MSSARLAVCMPGVHDRPRSLDWARHFSRVQAPAGTAVLHHYHYDIARCRQVLAERAIETGASHILWWDDDCWPPVDGILRLIGHRYPWVTGVYADRNGALALGVFDDALQPGQMLKPTSMGSGTSYLDACGLGFCLMETAVLRRLQPPWFRFEHMPDGRYIGEDIHLSRRIRTELGMRVLVDWSVPVAQEEIVAHGADGSRRPVWQMDPGVVQRV